MYFFEIINLYKFDKQYLKIYQLIYNFNLPKSFKYFYKSVVTLSLEYTLIVIVL